MNLIKMKTGDGDAWYLSYGNDPDGVPVQIDDPIVTTENLIDCWQMKLEGDNYHSMMSIPENLVKVLKLVGCAKQQIKEALWEILTRQDGWS